MQNFFIFTKLCRFRKVEICRIEREVNRHFTANVSGVVLDQNPKAQIFLKSHLPESRLAIAAEDGTLIFCGVVRNMKILRGVEGHRVWIQACSDSWLLDRQVRPRRFFDSAATYGQVMADVLWTYGMAGVFDNRLEQQQSDTRLIQYEETDWAFLKRLAGKAHTVICLDTSGIWGSVLLGISRKQPLAKACFLVRRMRRWRGYVEFEVESPTHLPLCSKTRINDLFVYLYKSVTYFAGGRLNYRYWFRTWAGIPVPRGENENLRGVTLPGRVLNVAEDQVQVQLDVETEGQSRPAGWFSCQGSEGWYVLPEKGEAVALYFPDSLEEHGYLVRK